MRALVFVLIAGCGAATAVRTDLEEQGSLVQLSGVVDVVDWTGAPLVAAVLEVPEDPHEPFLVADYQILDRPGDAYSFLLPPRRYRIVAFEDDDRDLEYSSAERVCPWNAFADLVAEPGSRHTHLDLTIAGVAPEGEAMPSYRGPSGEERSIWIGAVLPLDDPRFGPENGRRGMWEPLEFMRDVGSGLFLLEPYDPARIPVLFVHGIAGYPREFEALVGALDRSRFQPWVLQYASGFPLEIVTDYAARALREIVAVHHPEAICVVAHSMGGVVMRQTLALHDGTTDRTDSVPLFITLASPLGGHPAAASGAAYSPLVVPVWRSLVPEGPFISSLFARRLPSETRYDLLYADGSGDTDGVVPVASQRRIEAEREAALVRGFAVSHTGILASEEAIALVEEELASHCVPRAVGVRTPTLSSPASAIAEDVGCDTPWYLDAARGADTLTCRMPDGTEVSTECEGCAAQPETGNCFADLPGEVVERRARDGTHHRFSASHLCQPACCRRAELMALPMRRD